MNPGELRNKISLLSYANIEGVYRFIEEKTIFAKAENEYKRKNYSSFGVGTSEVTNITFRYRKDIDKSKAISFNGGHYLISSIDDVENRHRYLNVISVKQRLYNCESFRNITIKDEFNRPQRTLNSIYKFEGYLTEKYAGYNTENIKATTELTLILMTPKVIELKAGDIVEIDTVKYNVDLAHKLDEYLNEYEITVIKDV